MKSEKEKKNLYVTGVFIYYCCCGIYKYILLLLSDHKKINLIKDEKKQIGSNTN